MSGDTDTTFVEDANGVFVAMAFFSKQVSLGDIAVVKVDDAGGGGFDAEFLFLFGDAEAGSVFVYDEGCDALVAFGGIQVGEDDEEAGFEGVCDPHLGAVDAVAVGRLFGAGLEGEGIGAGDGF